jgi:SPP1 family predicted phage head-tail adaptor
MTTTTAIAKAAFDGVAAGITDAVLTGTLNDGATNYTGRVVFGGETAPTGFPMSKIEARTRPAYLEGFSAVAAVGWTLTADSVTYYVTGVRNIVEGGGLVVASVISGADMLWKTVTIERQTRTADGAGGFTTSWATHATVSGGIWSLSGNERWQSDRVEETSKWRMVIPFQSGLKPTDRVVIDSVTYNVTFANDVEQRGTWHVLDLSGGVAT